MLDSCATLLDVLTHCAQRVPLYRGVDAPRPGESSADALARFPLLDKATLRGAWVRTESRSGWLDHLGKPSPVFQAASAGSTWLFQVQGDDPLPTLRSAERLGLGKYRELGLGRLIFSPDTDTR